MRPQVDLQVGRQGEGLATLGAVVEIYPRVNSQVPLERCGELETFVAVRALEGPGLVLRRVSFFCRSVAAVVVCKMKWRV